ncbi:MAG: hypothetical protein ACLTDR_11300 [Adlercreutzia equolifaciens]
MSVIVKHNSIAKRKDGRSREHFSLREFRLVAKLRFGRRRRRGNRPACR